MESLLKQSLSEIRTYFVKYGLEVVSTIVEDVYMIKYGHETDIKESCGNQYRGLVFNNKSGAVLSMGYPVPYEYNELSELEQETCVKMLHTQNYHVDELLDGTLLRLWYFTDKSEWFLSTNRKLDSREAFWMNNRSFYDQFWSCDPSIHLDELDKNYVYLFILCHPLNVIVVNHEKPHIFHVGTYDRRTCEEIEVEIGVEHPRRCDMTIEEVLTNIKTSEDKPVSSAGYMVRTRVDGLVRRYRFENNNYTRARELRGDSNNQSYFILNLLVDENQQKLLDFIEYYPIYRNETTKLYQRINSLVAKFYREYGQRFKEHKVIEVHPRHHRFLKELHEQVYLNQLKKIGRTVQYQDIMDYVKKLPAARLLYLLNYTF